MSLKGVVFPSVTAAELFTRNSACFGGGSVATCVDGRPSGVRLSPPREVGIGAVTGRRRGLPVAVPCPPGLHLVMCGTPGCVQNLPEHTSPAVHCEEWGRGGVFFNPHPRLLIACNPQHDRGWWPRDIFTFTWAHLGASLLNTEGGGLSLPDVSP